MKKKKHPTKNNFIFCNFIKIMKFIFNIILYKLKKSYTKLALLSEIIFLFFEYFNFYKTIIMNRS